MLAVTVVEAFFNVFFRVVVSEPSHSHHEQYLLKHIKDRKSLDFKLKNWPKDILGTGLDFTAPIPKAFLKLKDKRNALMHFTSSHETLSIPGLELEGLADTSVFDDLTANDASDAMQVAESFIAEIFRLHGYSDEQIPAALHLWTGKVPI